MKSDFSPTEIGCNVAGWLVNRKLYLVAIFHKWNGGTLQLQVCMKINIKYT